MNDILSSMAFITETTYPLMMGVLMAGIALLAYSIVKDILARIQPQPELADQPRFDQLSPQERANLDAQARAERVRTTVMHEKQRKQSVTDMLDQRFGDPKPQEPEPPKRRWFDF